MPFPCTFPPRKYLPSTWFCRWLLFNSLVSITFEATIFCAVFGYHLFQRLIYCTLHKCDRFIQVFFSHKQMETIFLLLFVLCRSHELINFLARTCKALCIIFLFQRWKGGVVEGVEIWEFTVCDVTNCRLSR